LTRILSHSRLLLRLRICCLIHIGTPTRFTYYFKQTIVSSDLGLVFDNFIQTETYQFDYSSRANTNLSIREAFGNVSFYISARADIHKRTYVKLQVLVANIGGIVNFIYILASLIVTYVTNKSLMLNYVNNRLHDQDTGVSESVLESSNIKLVNFGSPEKLTEIKK
jgi:hypothetical protein